MDVNYEAYDRGEPLGSAHSRKAQLARDKIKAQRYVAGLFPAEMRRAMAELGWEWHEVDLFRATHPGRPVQWVWRGGDARN